MSKGLVLLPILDRSRKTEIGPTCVAWTTSYGLPFPTDPLAFKPLSNTSPRYHRLSIAARLGPGKCVSEHSDDAA